MRNSHVLAIAASLILPITAQSQSPKRSFGKPCDAVWPAAVATIMDANVLQITQSDRQGGVMTFQGTEEFVVPYGKKNHPLDQLFRSWVVNHPVSTAMAYRIEPSTLVVIPGEKSCTAQVAVRYVGLFHQGNRRPMAALSLASNGALESGLLTKIAETVEPPPKPKQEKTGQEQPEEWEPDSSSL